MRSPPCFPPLTLTWDVLFWALTGRNPVSCGYSHFGAAFGPATASDPNGAHPLAEGIWQPANRRAGFGAAVVARRDALTGGAVPTNRRARTGAFICIRASGRSLWGRGPGAAVAAKPWKNGCGPPTPSLPVWNHFKPFLEMFFPGILRNCAVFYKSLFPDIHRHHSLVTNLF